MRNEMEFNRRSRAQAESMIPDIEALRAFLDGIIPESLVGEWGEDFAEECDNFMSNIREGFIYDEPSLLGHFIRLPHLPIGDDWLNLIPLVEQVWIDRRVVELCEACAYLGDEGFRRMPAYEPHSTAWHRFYPPNTSWKLPIAADHEVFTAALDCRMLRSFVL